MSVTPFNQRITTKIQTLSPKAAVSHNDYQITEENPNAEAIN